MQFYLILPTTMGCWNELLKRISSLAFGNMKILVRNVRESLIFKLYLGVNETENCVYHINIISHCIFSKIHFCINFRTVWNISIYSSSRLGKSDHVFRVSAGFVTKKWNLSTSINTISNLTLSKRLIFNRKWNFGQKCYLKSIRRSDF